MQLSILLPTHRHDLLACSRIAQACSWAGPNIEVIVRDNSGDARKREIIAHFRHDNCNVLIADPCPSLENFSEILRLAKGEFIFCIGDDDACFDRGIAALPGIIEQVRSDNSVVGVSGPYAVEASKGSVIINYQGVDSSDVGARVVGYLNELGPNVLLYSALRREVVERVFALLQAMPFGLSFHDQIVCLLYLLNGKFVRLQRLFYLYDFGDWEVVETAQKRDVDYYKGAGLDPAINKLHWYMCGFEGAVLALNSNAFPDLPAERRQAIADHWFVTMYARFKAHERLTFGSPFTGEVERLCQKLRGPAAPTSFGAMLAEIVNIISVCSKSRAQEYFDYWDAVVNKRTPVPRAQDASILRTAVAS